jgi:hypothetical protein
VGTDTTPDLTAQRSASAEQLLSQMEANGGCSDEAADAIGVVLAEMEALRTRVAWLEAGETRTEWAEKHGGQWTGHIWSREAAARYFVGKRRQSGYTLHTRTVHESPWVPVEDEAGA